MVVKYNSDDGLIVTSLKFDSTIIPMVVNNAEFFLLLGVNVGISAAYHTRVFRPEEFGCTLPWHLTSTTGGLMTFFVVFYNSNCFARYNDLYAVTKEMMGAILELASSLRGRLPDKHYQRRAIRFVLASCFVFFFERTKGGISDNEWNQCKDLSLLTSREIEQLMSVGDMNPSFHCLHWALEVIVAGTPDVADHDDMINALFDKVHRIRSCHAKIRDTLDLPMPFQYFHLMSFMMFLNLALWSYALAISDPPSYFTPVIYLFIQMIFQGMRELSAALADPFGDDDVDFPITDWLWQIVGMVVRLLEDDFDAQAGVNTEEALPVPPMDDDELAEFLEEAMRSKRTKKVVDLDDGDGL